MKLCKQVWRMAAVLLVGCLLLSLLSGCKSNATAETESVQVPIILYHHLAQEAQGDMTISESRFREQMEALFEAGYNPVSFDDLIAFVENRTPLPDHPIVITFDDGYMSNYEIAYPILKEYRFKAAIFIIGVTFGQDTYKDTGFAVSPHFGMEEAREMISSGLISIQSHTYDMHRVEGLDSPDMMRRGVLQTDGESDEDYRAAFIYDYKKSNTLIQEITGESNKVYAYPYGLYNTGTEVWLEDLGVQVTLTTDEHINTVKTGKPDTLRLMGRYTITEDYSAEDVLNILV